MRVAWRRANRTLGKCSSRVKRSTRKSSRKLKSHWYRVSTLVKSKKSLSQGRTISMIFQWIRNQAKATKLRQLKTYLKSQSQLLIFSKNKLLCSKTRHLLELLRICSTNMRIRSLSSLQKINTLMNLKQVLHPSLISPNSLYSSLQRLLQRSLSQRRSR